MHAEHFVDVRSAKRVVGPHVVREGHKGIIAILLLLPFGRFVELNDFLSRQEVDALARQRIGRNATGKAKLLFLRIPYPSAKSSTSMTR